jgi:hypothetical protein
MDYTTLTLAGVRAELEAIARDAAEQFGGLDARQLNWRPDASRWSVAQCFDHLVTTNRQMLQTADDALAGTGRRPWLTRLPLVPGLLGRMLVRSQTPEATRKFTTGAKARPSQSEIDAGVVMRFVAQQAEAIARLDAHQGRDVDGTVMVSPFAGFVVYSVIDGWRLMAAHDRRHMQQARRVMLSPGFPH